jgi:hypothetical protein
VVKQVARELKIVLSPEEVERIEDEPTENTEAYNLYLQGRYFWNCNYIHFICFLWVLAAQRCYTSSENSCDESTGVRQHTRGGTC